MQNCTSSNAKAQMTSECQNPNDNRNPPHSNSLPLGRENKKRGLPHFARNDSREGARNDTAVMTRIPGTHTSKAY